MVAFLGTVVSPSSACSSPTIIRNRVVLPDPFGPTRPTFSPGLSWKDASTNRTWRPYCLLMRENAIMPGGRAAAAAQTPSRPAPDEDGRKQKGLSDSVRGETGCL